MPRNYWGYPPNGSYPQMGNGQDYNQGGSPQPQAGFDPMESLKSDIQQMIQASQGVHGTKLLELEERINRMMQQLDKGLVEFPEQFKLGCVKFPDRYPFPMILNVSMETFDGHRFGRTNELVRAIVKVDVDNPTILTGISFDMFKPDVEGNTGVVGAFLPLSAQFWNGMLQTADGAGIFPEGTWVYQGRDFRWRVRTSSDDRLWQTGWRSSAMLDGFNRMGYVLPLEYELRRNDSLIVEAEPIGVPPDPVQEWELNVYLHVYKMLQKRESTQ